MRTASKGESEFDLVVAMAGAFETVDPAGNQPEDAQLAAQQREINALKQKDASINTLSERLAALEQQVRTANSARFDSLARK